MAFGEKSVAEHKTNNTKRILVIALTGITIVGAILLAGLLIYRRIVFPVELTIRAGVIKPSGGPVTVLPGGMLNLMIINKDSRAHHLKDISITLYVSKEDCESGTKLSEMKALRDYQLSSGCTAYLELKTVSHDAILLEDFLVSDSPSAYLVAKLQIDGKQKQISWPARVIHR